MTPEVSDLHVHLSPPAPWRTEWTPGAAGAGAEQAGPGGEQSGPLGRWRRRGG